MAIPERRFVSFPSLINRTISSFSQSELNRKDPLVPDNLPERWSSVSIPCFEISMQY